jgi:hypothetical protein
MGPMAAAVLLAAAACGGDDDGAGDGDAAPRAVTWHQDIAPIVAEHCQGCHRDGGVAPFSLERYENAFPAAGLMALRVEEGLMPPWSAVDGDDCAPRFGWKHDPRLDADEEALLRAWVDAGAPAGDPADAAPLPTPDLQRLTGVTHTLSPATPFSTSGTSDQFICFVLDPAIDRTMWLTGLDVRPGDVAVVHHAVITAIPPDQAAAVRALGGASGQFDCFSGVPVAGAYALGVWVPGTLPFETAEGVAIPLAAGSIAVMQIHYHPGGTSHEPESTTVELRLTEATPEKMMFITAVGNAAAAPLLLPGPADRAGPEFRIPAGAPDHLETMRFPISIESSQRFPIVSMFPHMHYVGVDLEATISRGAPAPGEPLDECLIKSAWNFDWQRTYSYDAPLDQLPTVGDGDVITLRCRYDNTLGNPFVARGLADQGLDRPIDVTLGEQTLDEMCLIGFGVLVDL